MYWYETKNREKQEVVDWIVFQNGGAEEYFNNPAIKKWGHVKDEKEKQQ